MRFRDALKWSLKYHSIAVFPTLLGLGIIVAAVYAGAVEPVLPVLRNGSPSMEMVAAVVTSINAPLVVGGIALGIFSRRVGRTALLVRTQGQVVDAALAARESTGEATSGDTNGDFASAGAAETYDDSFTSSGGEDEATTEATARTSDSIDADAGDDEFSYGGVEEGATGR